MPSKTEIANRALQLLGDQPVLDITDNNKRAKACDRAYDPVRRAELRKNAWNFAKRRVVLAPDTAAPAFGATYQYTAPADLLRILRDIDRRDWEPEGGKILTDDGPSINLRYIADATDAAAFDALFAEMLSASIAMSICETITGSSTKLQDAQRAYGEALAEAKKLNAFEQPAQGFPADDWLLARY